MSESFSEKRDDPRIDSRAAVFLELEAADPDSGAPARILMCRLLDVSASGMRLRVDRPLGVGNVLGLCARFGRAGKNLRVVGEVRWIREADGFYVAGFSLFETACSDIAEWKLLVADAL